MIGYLPQSLEVNGKNIPIRTDYRDILVILEAYNDVELSDKEKSIVTVLCLYKEPISEQDFEEALNKAIWFLNCGNTVSKPHTSRPLYSWEQDEQMIFSSINKVAGKEIRALEYMHFWTFIGLFNEIGEGTFLTIVSIRNKKQQGKKLDKAEAEFYRKNKDIIDLKKTYTKDELAQLEKIDEILGIKKGSQ